MPLHNQRKLTLLKNIPVFCFVHSLFYTSGEVWVFFWIFPFRDPVFAPKEDDGLCHSCLRWDITKNNAWAIACKSGYY